MRLHELELVGFKSFGDRTRLRFDPAFTAIVGPNGSGKSNLVDAIRWLLGEQSHKQLRTPDSSEILFQGEQQIDRMNFAEVSMTLMPVDEELLQGPGDPLAVGRHYERDGTNHYLLNGSKSRLKEVRATLNEAGFGLNAMSILSQGRIDAVLSLHPAERRVILEEVSQIHGFQVNKDKTLEKISQTRDNLQRLEDVLREVTDRMAELAQQALAARRHGELITAKADREQALLGRDLDRRASAVAGLRRELADAEAAVASYRQQVAQLREELGEMEATSQQLQGALTTHLAEQAELAVRASESRNLAARQSEQASQVQATLTGLTRRREALESRRKDLLATEEQTTTEIDGLRGHVSSAQERAVATRTEWNALREELTGTEAAWQAARTSRASLEAQQQRIERDLAVLESSLVQLTQALEELGPALSEVADTLPGCEQAVDRAKSDAAEAEAIWQEAQHAVAPAAEAVQASRDQVARLESTLQESRGALAECTGERKSLEQLEKAREGFEGGGRALLDATQRGKLAATLAPLLENVTVTPGYELAVEAALGPLTQALIASDWTALDLAFDWLVQHDQGRAVLIAPELVPAPHNLPEAPKARTWHHDPEPGEWAQVPAPRPILTVEPTPHSLRTLADVITAPPESTAIIAALCGSIRLTDSLESARRAHAVGDRATWVTTHGEVLHPWGAVTAGATTALVGGMISRHARLDLLRESEIALQQQMDDLAAALTAARSRELEAGRALDQARQKAQDSRARHTEALHQLTRAEQTLKQTEAAMIQLQNRQSTAVAKSTEAERQAEGQRDLLQQVMAQLEGTANAAALEQQVIRLREDVQRAQVATHENDLRARDLASRLTALEKSLAEANAERIRLDAEADPLHLELSAAEEALTALEGDLPQLELFASEAATALEASRAEETRLRTALHEAQQGLAESRSDLAGLDGDLAQALGEKESLQIRLARAEADVDLLGAQVREHPWFQATFPSLAQGLETLLVDPAWKAFLEPLAPAAQLKRELADIEVQLTELGEVNTLAARDYGHQEERHGTLKTQRQDLLDAILDLEASLKEIEQKSKLALQEVYERTRSNFQEVFAELFPGGEARLEWSDPERILESGLEISVHFPGKGVRHLMQFSGGERTLIAIAFLFAVLQAKPPTFVILDEVEAALDDANVEKFLRLVDLYKHHFQFIVITHNKLTMEHAPLLYGVTLRKGGHSQILSVRVQEWIAAQDGAPVAVTALTA